MPKPRIKRSVGKALDARGFSLQEVYGASKSTALRVFHGFWGRSMGKLLVGGASPLKGVTVGIADHDKKIEAIRSVNPNNATRCEAFSKKMSGHNEKGICVVRGKKGYAVINAAAAAAAGLDPIVTRAHGWQMKAWLRSRPDIKAELVEIYA